MRQNKELLLAFYGDDFTGSTDALEFICRAGARAVLFIEPPDVKQLEAFDDLDVIGVAGKTRSLPADELETTLETAFHKMKDCGAKHIHYKVCSTFDSSAATGSIGRAIDTGQRVFGNPLVPVLGGTPSLGRYCVFGNLFARMGIGSEGAIYRLDRHPSMSKHPVTPADESDLRIHLQRQTEKRIGLIDIMQLCRPPALWNAALGDEQAVLIDALYEAQLVTIGEWLDGHCVNPGGAIFSVGTSAIEMALGRYWNQKGVLQPVTTWDHPGKAAPLLVISGSCSPVTAGQIGWAKANGFEELVLDATKACNDEPDTVLDEKLDRLLANGNSVVIHTGTKEGGTLSSRKLGTTLGGLAKKAVVTHRVKRVVIAGGDTSSYAARAMEIEAVEMIAPLVSGAPLCRARSLHSAINGLEVNFKGGQVGAADYFGVLLNGELEKTEGAPGTPGNAL
ncbi:four-carbon acid sugar kinase family protein [Niabella aurantiaca]|uniref:four-carbon acid sugar kinase family protein n=1 Tax=Niabella aurantiaca TaxID=379900 RepID=UPI00037DF659|nr:four-carbon acid sugar kinase family protein [Niabella aurantiaca]